MKSFITSSPSETIKLGQKIAKRLTGVVCLYGELGAGKTTLIKGIAQGLGIKKIITSPTFVLMKIYQLRTQGPGPRVLIHLDCYRLNSEMDIVNIGALEYIGRPDTVTVIEWADKIKKFLPSNCMKITIKILKDNKREFTILKY